MSVRLKSRTQCPPGGFKYRQAETGWELEAWDFKLLCAELQKHRKANPKYRLQVDMAAIENEVDLVNAARVNQIAGADIYLQPGDLPVPKAVPLPLPLRQAARVAVGGGVNLDWLTSGAQAVPREQAENRAATCVACPKHGKGDITAYFTVPVIKAIQLAVNQCREWKLETSLDDKLAVCEACQCPLRLKIHMPLDRVTKKLPVADRADLDSACWILAEEKALSDPPSS